MNLTMRRRLEAVERAVERLTPPGEGVSPPAWFDWITPAELDELRRIRLHTPPGRQLVPLEEARVVELFDRAEQRWRVGLPSVAELWSGYWPRMVRAHYAAPRGTGVEEFVYDQLLAGE